MEEKLKELIDEWRNRQHLYEDMAERYKDNPRNNAKYVYKALGTRDCWKELLTLIESKDE
jgi:hypothetical protein